VPESGRGRCLDYKPGHFRALPNRDIETARGLRWHALQDGELLTAAHAERRLRKALKMSPTGASRMFVNGAARSTAHRRRCRIRPLIIAILGVVCATAFAADTPSPAPSPEELRGISARGRQLAAYDQAAWHGTDAVKALSPNDALVKNYIARPDADGKWSVAFGHRTPADDAFEIDYEATQTTGPADFVGRALTPPRADTDYFLRAARALDLVRAEFKPPYERPYVIAVLPAAAEGWYVYAYPAVVRLGVWPLGGDTRYTVSADGRSIVATRTLHKTIIEPPPAAGGKPVMGFHVHVLTDRPEDTDVMNVLQRQPPMTELIATHPWMYEISPSGGVVLLGRTEELLRDHRKP